MYKPSLFAFVVCFLIIFYLLRNILSFLALTFFATANSSQSLLRHDTTLSNPKKPASLCVVSRNYNQGRFYPEWIEYHLLLGVDHFFVSDDCSIDTSVDILQKYVDQGLVTLIRHGSAPGPAPLGVKCSDAKYRPNEDIQNSYLYTRVLLHGSCTMVGRFDVDEFVVSSNISNLPPYRFLVPYVLSLPKRILRMEWIYIGHDGKENVAALSSQLVINSYANLGELDGFRHVKSVTSIEQISYWVHSHYPHFNPDANMSEYSFPFETSFEPAILGSNGCLLPSKPVFLYHFYFKTWEDFQRSRVHRSFGATGAANLFKQDPRSRWDGGFLKHDCAPGKDFIRAMVPKVEEALEARWGPSRWPLSAPE